MIRTPMFVANWKMNHGPTEGRAYIEAFTAAWMPRNDRTLIFCPPAITLTTVVDALRERRDLAVGVQNIWTVDRGAFTGETSAPMAKDAGAAYVLVGHSERRHVFGETDAQAGSKCAAAVRSSLTPILCVGEQLNDREAGSTNDVVLRQLRAGLAELTADSIRVMIVAYEPVWAIGTGKTATPNDASAVHAVLRAELRTLVGTSADSIPILYGGSVNRDNTKSLLAAQGVDGVLVGGASLDVDGWASICNT